MWNTGAQKAGLLPHAITTWIDATAHPVGQQLITHYRPDRPASRQQNFLGYFGPLSLILLLGFWAAGLIFGFALIQYGMGGHEQLSGERLNFGKILYHSGETFFTLGYGDIVPTSGGARALSVLEAGMGFAFLGVVIGYIPVVYSSFSRREIQISMLDARAGSPPAAVELLVRLAGRSEDPGVEQEIPDHAPLEVVVADNRADDRRRDHQDDRRRYPPQFVFQSRPSPDSLEN